MKIPCLVCDKPIKLQTYINTQNYDGEVVCRECNSLLHIKLVKSKLEKYRLVKADFPPQKPDFG